MHPLTEKIIQIERKCNWSNCSLKEKVNNLVIEEMKRIKKELIDKLAWFEAEECEKQMSKIMGLPEKKSLEEELVSKFRTISTCGQALANATLEVVDIHKLYAKQALDFAREHKEEL